MKSYQKNVQHPAVSVVSAFFVTICHCMILNRKVYGVKGRENRCFETDSAEVYLDEGNLVASVRVK
ncbi:MAG: hypothetical protein D3924_14165 [Candidatus Electrothrix sp. AR4]|nr:hypothetical protein [Candidatus Electrothrix sp. AR4]